MASFTQEKLLAVADRCIEAQDHLDHEEESGNKVLHVHFDVEDLEAPQYTTGRQGDFYKFAFTYTVEVIEEAYPDEPYKARYRRQVRIDALGNVLAVGARALVARLDA
jgi:hypothetical protein